MPIDCQRSSAYGEAWRNTIRGLFDERIKAGAITIFGDARAINRA
jgi:hypothetical protein